MQSIFWNAHERRLRALWRLLLQALLMVLLGVAPILIVAEPLTALHRRGLFLPHTPKALYDPIVNIIIGPLLTLGIVASVALAARYFDRRPGLARFGFVFDRRGWKLLALGFAISAFVMSAVFLVEWSAGWVAISGTLVRNGVLPFSLGIAVSLTKMLCVPLYEEVLSRGYHLRNISEGLGERPWIAATISSLIFALLHLTNDNASAMSVVGIFVNAMLFATALFITQRLSTAIGLHAGWNAVQGVVFGFPVSGDKEPASLIGIVQRGPQIMTGGAFGPEAGLLGIAASLAGIAIILLATPRRRSDPSTSPGMTGA